MRFVLVHSPALGPATWRWVAEALAAEGHEVEVPDLRAALDAGPGAFADAAGGDAGVVVVGHSGAGALLPLVPAGRRLFVDAGVPVDGERGAVGGGFLARLRELAAGRDRLPPWPAWWGPGVLESLVPDEERRGAVAAEAGEVPVAFYEAEVAWPTGWTAEPAGYLLTSDAYREDADRATALGWPVTERTSGHLGIVTAPEAIAAALLALAA